MKHDFGRLPTAGPADLQAQTRRFEVLATLGLREFGLSTEGPATRRRHFERGTSGVTVCPITHWDKMNRY